MHICYVHDLKEYSFHQPLSGIFDHTDPVLQTEL